MVLTASVLLTLRAFFPVETSCAVAEAMKATTAMRDNRMRMVIRGFETQMYGVVTAMFPNELLRLAEDRVPEGAYCLRKRPSKLRPPVLAT